MKVFIDIDGTILDITKRYYYVFCDCLVDGKLSFECYKNLKMRYVKDSEIARLAEVRLRNDYFDVKKEMLESEKYLVYDTPIISPTDLKTFTEKHCVYALSKRRYADRLKNQLKKLGFDFLLNSLTVLDWGKEVKKQWIEKNVGDEEIILIGDGEEEVCAAQLNNVKLVLVKSGLYVPKACVDSVQVVNDISQALSLIDC